MLSIACQVNGQVTSLPDTINSKVDSISNDSISEVDSTHLKNKKAAHDGLKSEVIYSAQDSSRISSNKKVYLFGKAKVTYEDIELKADYMEYDGATKVVYASGLPDSTGVVQGKPEFTQKSQKFKFENIYYNFTTKKAIIHNVITEEEGGFLHAEKTKRFSNGHIDLKNGKYTTCDAEHPHFYLKLTKGIAIPNDKIVFGPAYLVIADIPMPVALPFGFFPNKKESTSGIIIPAYGSDFVRGFSLRDGGYYFAISKYTDLRLTGDIYSKGTWGLSGMSRYIKRYKFTGNLSMRYYVNKYGEEGIDQTSARDFALNWSHNQDPKANPTSTFGASVNYTSNSFDQNHNYHDPVAYVQTQKTSNVNYSKTWTNFNLSSSLSASQNTRERTVDLSLPIISFSANRIYPFRKKESSGNLKWWDNITINYNADLQNQIHSGDSTVFTTTALKNGKNGFHHRLPLSVNFKVLKFFNITPSINYEGMLYTSYVERIVNDTISPVTKKPIYRYKEEVGHKISYVQGFSPSLGMSFIQPWYGRFMFGKQSKIQDIRHVITPSIGFSFVPPLASLVPKDYYRKYISSYDTINKVPVPVYTEYSIYQSNSYGTPSVPKRSGGLTFGLTNNLEMKVKSDKDTVTGIKKIVIIQSLGFSSSYNLFAESYKLSNISFNGTIPVFKGLDFSFNGSIDPYQYKYKIADLTGRTSLVRVDKYYWQDHFSLGQLTNFSFSMGYRFQAGQAKTKQTQEEIKPRLNGAPNLPDPHDKALANNNTSQPTDYNYFKIPWSFSFNYSFNYTKTLASNDSVFRNNVMMTLGFNGDLSLTPKWKINFSSGYDFKVKQFSHTNFSIQRDLHCWMMSVDFSPFGAGRYYSFRINVMSAMLHDLKYEKRQDYNDYMYSNY